MTRFKSEFLSVLDERGLLYQGSDLEGLDALMARETLSAYIGFDATAPSLHVGSMLPIMMLYWLQQTGHRPVILMGGGTTKIGDPSFKTETRAMLAEERIQANIKSIQTVFARIVNFGEGPTDALLLNNDDWLSKLHYLPFLRDFGAHFSINRMMTMDSVKLRLERDQSLSFLEFNYMILQGYDFLELNRRHNVRLQMGGSDQWGNIIQGLELGRRVDGASLFALTCPLMTTASGAKMGKTESGAIWLDKAMLEPYEFWQYWRNTEDADVARFLKLFTTLPLSEVARLEKLGGAEINEAKKILAREVTTMLHGREAAEIAAETAEKTFSSGETAADLPGITVTLERINQGYGVLTAFVDLGLCASTSEARRHIKGGALRVNDKIVTDDKYQLTPEDGQDGHLIKLSLGRKRHKVLKLVD